MSPGAAQSSEHTGSDRDEAVHFYTRLYDAHRVDLSGGADSFAYRVRSVGDADVTLRSSKLSADRWGRIEPEGRYILAWVQRGVVVVDAGTTSETVCRPGTATVYPVGRPFTLVAPAGATIHTVDFTAGFLEGLDATRRDEEPRALRILGTRNPNGTRALQEQLALAAPELLRPATDPVRRSSLNAAVGRRVLDAFVGPAPVTAPRRRGVVDRALEFIANHAADPIMVQDIATSVGLSERGLHQAFASAGLPSPMKSVRRERLRRVRDTLSHADPEVRTVAEVAEAWGFEHLGRFAHYYKDEFGEFPSATLRVSRRTASLEGPGSTEHEAGVTTRVEQPRHRRSS